MARLLWWLGPHSFWDLPCFRLDRLQHVGFVGEGSGLELRIQQLFSDLELEAASFGRDEGERLDVLLEVGEKLGRQTDGLRLVVSHRAVFERDLHEGLQRFKATRKSVECTGHSRVETFLGDEAAASTRGDSRLATSSPDIASSRDGSTKRFRIERRLS